MADSDGRQGELLTPERFPPHGLLYLAGADVATHDAGWIEGAFLSGAAAASWVLDARAGE